MLLKDGVGWSGDYATWQLAQQQCVGYDAANILEKVKDAILKVKNGEAVYERDSVLFDEIRYSHPLLVTLLWKALKNNSKLNVIDFGGSLGSSYFQNKLYLDDIKELHWRIVEQPAFVESGIKHIQDKRISFHNSLKDAQDQQPANLLIISCAIQYMEKPYELIEKILQFNISHIIIDNTPFNNEYRDRLTVQKVPPSIYTASYPCWFLNIEKVIEAFGKKYSLLSEHFNDDFIELDGNPIPYQGFVLELKK
ncbi:MAG: methyltransferase, TIGR04325 family [Chitinophagaceae bacterium]